MYTTKRRSEGFKDYNHQSGDRLSWTWCCRRKHLWITVLGYINSTSITRYKLNHHAQTSKEDTQHDSLWQAQTDRKRQPVQYDMTVRATSPEGQWLIMDWKLTLFNEICACWACGWGMLKAVGKQGAKSKKRGGKRIGGRETKTDAGGGDEEGKAWKMQKGNYWMKWN